MNKKSMFEVFWENVERCLVERDESLHHFEISNGFQTGQVKKWKRREAIPHWKVVAKICDYFNIYYDVIFLEVEE